MPRISYNDILAGFTCENYRCIPWFRGSCRRGKGIPELRGRGRGDQYVTVRVAVPTGLNGEQKEALRAFAAAMGEIPAQEEEEGLKGFFDKRKRKK